MLKLFSKTLLLILLCVFYTNWNLYSQLVANAGNDAFICPAGSVQLGSATPHTGGTGPFTYSWAPITGLSNATIPNPICTVGATTNYTLTVTDASLPAPLTDTDVITVTFSPNPTSSFTASGGNNQCANLPISFTNTSVGGTTYAWDFGNPLSGISNTSTLQDPTHIFISTGDLTEDFIVTLTTTNAAGCQATSTQTITVRRTPGQDLIDPNTAFKNCNGASINFTFTSFDVSMNANNSAYRIIWGDGTADFNGVTFPGAGETHTYTTQGVFDMQYIVTGNNGCADTTLIPVANTSNPSIGVATLGGTTGCAPLSLCFPISSFAANHNTTIYTIDYGDGTPIDTVSHPPPNQFCHTYLISSCPTDYTFTIQATNLCNTSQATVNPIEIYGKPVADIEATPTVACINTPVLFINNSVLGNNSACSSFTNFSWDFGDGFPPQIINSLVSNGVTHSFPNPGTYTVTLTTSNFCGPSSDVATVCIEAPPTPGFSVDVNTSCIPFDVKTNDLSVIANDCNTTFSWASQFITSSCAPFTGTSSFINGTNSNTLEPEFQFSSPGTFQIQQTLTNSCGNFLATQNIIAQAPPEIGINPVSSICGGQSITPTGIFNDCLESINTYLWNFPGGSIPSSALEIPGTISYAVNGSYTITLTATNSCGTDIATTAITVNDVPPVVNPFTVSPLCAGYDAIFVSDTVINASYTWSGPNGFTSNLQNPIISNVSIADAGLYSVFASFGTCSGTSESVNLVILPITIVNAGNDVVNCVDDIPFTIVPTTPAGGMWSGNGINAAGLFNPSLAGAGIHTLTYTFSDPITLCVYSDSITATVNSLPIIDAGLDISLCNQAIPNVLTPIVPLNGIWSGPGITNPAGEFTPSVNGVFDVFYSITDANGCFNEDTLSVTVIDPTNADAGLDSVICENGNNVQLTGLPIGGTWSGIGISATGDYDPTVPGNFTMTYTFGSGTCQTSDNMDFIVNPMPTVDAGLDFTICLDGGNVDLSVLPIPVGGTWSGNGIINPTGTFDPLVAGNGSHILTYSIIDPITNCSNTDFLTANVNALPVVNAGNDTTLCNQPVPVQLIGLPAGGLWSGPDITPGGIYTPNGVGTFKLYYSFTLSSCLAIDSMLVTIVDPAIADAGNDQEVCFSNTQFTLVGIPAGGTWSGIGIAANGDFTPNSPGTYQLTYSFGGGNCLTTDDMQLIVHDLPIVDAGLDVSFCESEAAVNFIGNPLNGTWSGTGITNALFGTFDPSIANIGINTLTYSFTDPITTCTNTDELLVLINPLPNVSFSFNPITCTGVSESFANNTILGNDYLWNFGDNTATNILVNPSHSYSSTGFFNIKLIATTIDGCIDSLSQAIEVREAPIVDFRIAPDSACGPLLVNFVNNSSGIAPLTFDWNFGNGQNSALQDPNPETYNAGIIADTSYYITLNVTNFCGTVSATDSVKVMPKPKAIFGPQFDVGCSPFTLEFANNSYGLPDNYSWDFGNGVTSNTSAPLFNQIFVTGADDTTFTIKLIVTNECGIDSAFHVITILPTSVNSFFNTNITQGCAPLTVDFTNFSSGGQQYVWDFGDLNFAATTDATNTFTAPGTYVVKLIVIDDCSRDTSEVTITVHPTPQIEFAIAPNLACVGQNFQFTNQSTNVTNLMWDFGDLTSSILTNPTHAYQNGGNYQVTLSGTSTIFACQASVTHQVTVSNSPDASFTFNPNGGCIPANVTFTNTSQLFNFVNWDFGDGNVSSTNSPLHTYTVAGVYTVNLVVENNIGCQDSISQIIQIFPIPTADFNITNADSCKLPAQVLTSNASIGATNYDWNFGNGFTSNLTNPNAFYDTPGTYFIKLIATNQYGCKDSLIKDLTIYSPPVANFVVSDQTLCEGDDFFGTSLSLLTDSVRWFMGDGIEYTSTVINHEYQNTGNYFVTLVAYGQGTCSDTMFASVPIVVNITPNANFSYVNVEEANLINGTIDFTNLSSNANSYLWLLDDDSTSTKINPSYLYNHFGNVEVTLIAYNDNGCIDSITKLITIDYFKGLFVPNAMYPDHPSFEVSHFLPKGVGLLSYHITIYDDWGNLIWESKALDSYGRPTESWNATYNGVPVQQDAYVWKVEASYMTSEVWEGKEYPDGKIKRAGTVTVIR